MASHLRPQNRSWSVRAWGSGGWELRMKLLAWKPQPGSSSSCVSLSLRLQTTVWPLAPMTSLASAPHSLHSVSWTSFRKRRWMHLGVDEGRDLCSPPPPWGLSGAGCLAQWAGWGRSRESPASGQGGFSAPTGLQASGGSTPRAGSGIPHPFLPHFCTAGVNTLLWDHPL